MITLGSFCLKMPDPNFPAQEKQNDKTTDGSVSSSINQNESSPFPQAESSQAGQESKQAPKKPAFQKPPAFTGSASSQPGIEPKPPLTEEETSKFGPQPMAGKPDLASVPPEASEAPKSSQAPEPVVSKDVSQEKKASFSPPELPSQKESFSEKQSEPSGEQTETLASKEQPKDKKEGETIVSATPPPTAYIFGKGEGKGDLVKKILIGFLLVLILIGVSFAIYKFVLPKLRGAGAPSSQVTLTYWGLWEPSKAFTQVISDYQKEHPNIKINYTQQSHKDYRERLASAFARGEGPDIFRFHNTWTAMFKKDLSPIPADIYDAASYEATFYPVARQSLRQGTGYVGIPLEIDGLGLFINEEIFANAGKEPPTSWDELRKVALELTTYDSSGNIQIAGVALGETANVDHWSDILALMMLQNGASLENPTGNLAEDALSYFTLFSRIDKVWNDKLPPSTAAFANGKLAMYFGPSWRALNIKEANPSLDFRVVPVPQLPETNIAWASFWVEGVWSRSKNKKAAWEFLKYLSSRQVLQKLYQAQSQLRLFGEPYSRIDMAELLKNDRYLGAYITQASAAQTWYLCSRTFDNGINDRIIKYFEDAVNSVNQGQSPEKALETAASGVAQVLATYGLGTGVVR